MFAVANSGHNQAPPPREEGGPERSEGWFGRWPYLSGDPGD